jgi:colanic acid biosynthesis glycosyl transferase WcaI
VGIKLGVFRHRLVINLVEWMERFCLDRAAYVRVLSESFRHTLKGWGIPASKLVLVWDWLDTDFIRPMSRVNSFSTRWGLDCSFVVMYAGNIGLSQGLEHVVEAAGLLANEPSIRFVFVGDGAGKDSLQQVAHSSGLTHIQFIPFQPRELLPQVLASADVSLIALKRGVGEDSVPSKCYSILASGRPILAAVDEHSDTWTLVQRANAGLCVPPAKPDRLAEAVLFLQQRPELCQQMGQNGREYVLQHHSHLAAAREFENLLLKTLAVSQGNR